MRKDILVDNESTALMIASEALTRELGEDFSDSAEAWRKARREGVAWIIDTQEMPAVIRVLADVEPDPIETAAQIAVFRGGLHVPDGKIALIGGVLSGSEMELASAGQLMRVKVSPGWYRVELGLMIGSQHGPPELQGETLLDYWRGTRGGRAPAWVSDPDDPGGVLVDFLLTLHPVNEAEPGPAGGAYLTWGGQIQRPAVCPDAIFADQLERHDSQVYIQSGLEYVHDIEALLADVTAEPLDRPVSLPLADLVLPYWIAWAAGETHPQVRIENCGDWTCEWPGFKDGICESKTPTGWKIDIEGSNARWSQFGHLREIGRLIGSLPQGASLHLDCASDESEGREGFMHFAGTIQDGKWQILQTFPRLKAETLEAMLSTCGEAEEGPRFLVKDQSEGERILHACRTRDSLLSDQPPTLRAGEISLGKKNADLAPFLFARVFLERFHDQIPMIDRDDDVDG